MDGITVRGKIFTSSTADSRRALFADISEKLAKAVQEYVIEGFDRSVQLAAMVGERADQEALRAIYRSIKVKVKNVEPLDLEVRFEDDYSHWYGGEELPQEVADVLQEIIESSLNTWFNTPEPGDIIVEALVAT
jgi:hypothetical protein